MKGKCIACGRSFAVSDENVGRKVRCECGHVFVIQSPVPDVVEEPVPLGISEPEPTRDITSFARLHSKVFVAGATVFLVITFVGGLALGLNVHPPDQHELEVGFKTGHKSGHDKGMQEGMKAGYVSGMADGIKEGRLVGAREERNRLIAKVNKADEKARELEATIDKTKRSTLSGWAKQEPPREQRVIQQEDLKNAKCVKNKSGYSRTTTRWSLPKKRTRPTSGRSMTPATRNGTTRAWRKV